MAVGSAIGVLKAKTRRWNTSDAEPTVVHGAMMGRAERHEVISVVTAALGAQVEVMHVDEGGVPAAGDDAAAFVAAEDATAERWRDCLGCAVLRCSVGDARLWVTHVGPRWRAWGRRIGARDRPLHVTDVLRVTARHLDDRSVDFKPFAAGVLKAAPAPVRTA